MTFSVGSFAKSNKFLTASLVALSLAGTVMCSTVFAQAGAAAAPANDQPPAPVPLDKNKLSYALGFKLGLDMIESKTPVDIATVVRGVQDGFARKDPPAVPREDMGKQLYALEYKMRSEAEAEFKKFAAENMAKSQRFLAENKTKKNVVSLPSGIQYRVIEEGNGARPTAKSEVTVHYRGSLISGQEFDSSFARGVPAKFKLDQVLPGWQEVLPLMKVGDTWQVFLPPEKAYGADRAPRAIGPNQALQFEIKLIDVK
jgi:FKBP-type peptidyl-prolyl cis-trans isomerase FklB